MVAPEGDECGAGRGPGGREAPRLADPEHLSHQHRQVVGRRVDRIPLRAAGQDRLSGPQVP